MAIGGAIHKRKKELLYGMVIVLLLGTFFWSTFRAHWNPPDARQLCASVNTTDTAGDASAGTDTDEPTHTTLNGLKVQNTNKTTPTIFFITPTYARPTQRADLTRLSHTLQLVGDLHWILVEDSSEMTLPVTDLLENCHVKNTHLYYETQKSTKDPKKNKNRGAKQRNAGLKWLRDNYHRGQIEGVVYFGDDDNTYDVRLFDEMRYTKKVSVWPVGLAGGLLAEGPVCENGKVVCFHTSYAPDREFPMDMAGFALNIDLILTNPNANMDPNGRSGHMETIFLSKITTVPELEAKADNCNTVLVWHTQTKTPSLAHESKNPTTLNV